MLFESLKNSGGFKGEIKTDNPTLIKYSRDASIFEVKPACVVFPKDVEDVKKLIKFVSENKSQNPELSITARAAGTDMSGGAINDSIIADFTAHFNRIIRIGTDTEQKNTDRAGYAVVEPGVFYRDFEKEALTKNLLLPCFTASKSLNTLGGMAANNSAGEKSLFYGQTKDYVEELNVVLSDGNEYVFKELGNAELEQKLRIPGFEGEIYRKLFRLIKDNYVAINKAKPTTTKNAAGYLLWEVWNKLTFNLAKLIVGSQGTLGLITKIKFELVRPKPESQLLVIFLKDLSSLGNVVHTVAEHKPESFESFDDHTFKLAVRFLPDMIKRMKGNLIILGLKFFPELWMALTGGVPKLILIAEFTGDSQAEVNKKILEVEAEVREKFNLKTHIAKTADEAEKYWTIRRESFNLLRQHTHGLSTAPFIDDIIVHPDQLPVFLPELNAIFKKYPSLTYTIAGHAGDANFHIIPLMDLSQKSQRDIIPELANEVYSLVLKYKGSITAEHNDGLIRSPYLKKMYGREVTDLFAQVKQIFDPKNIFNPHKKVGASLEYSLSHIKKTL